MWEKILHEFTTRPRDIKTNPITVKPSLWFYVKGENGNIFLYPAKDHTPSCAFSTKSRRLDGGSEKCEKIFDLYLRRKVGKPVSQEATATTQNQVYWYGIFSELGF